MSELYFHTATQLARGYRRGEFSPVEAINAVLARIDHCESQLNAWRLVDKKRARSQARAAQTVRSASAGLRSLRRWRMRPGQSAVSIPAPGVLSSYEGKEVTLGLRPEQITNLPQWSDAVGVHSLDIEVEVTEHIVVRRPRPTVTSTYPWCFPDGGCR